MKRITLSDIAKALNTTPATVSRALNDHPRISKKTKKLIVDYADKVGFDINRIASSLRSGRTHVIGVLIPSAQINFFGSVVHGIEALASTNGYSVLIYQTNEKRENEIKGLDTFLSARVDGILVSLAKETKDFSHFENIKKKNVPVAFFDRSADEIGISSIVIDDYKGGFIATQHLIENNYKRIAYITGPMHIKAFSERYRGYVDALKKYDLVFDQSLVYEGNVSIEAGIEAVGHFIANDCDFDAIFAVEDYTALGALKELKNRDIKIPQDVGVMGFANEALDEHITPTLSSIDQQTVLMGRESFKLILELIENKNKYNVIPEKKIVLKPIPFFRNSTARRPLW